jgi:hypothetical protein
MPPRKTYKKKPVTKKKVAKKSKIYYGALTHHFKRKFSEELRFTITADMNTVGTARFYLGKNMRLTDMSNFGDFTNLFDLYRLDLVKLSFRNGFNVAQRSQAPLLGTGGNVQLGVPIISIVKDDDDSSTPTTPEQLLERPDVKTWLLDKQRNWYVKPCVGRVGSDNTGINYSYVQKKDRPQLDMGNPGVAYNGVKLMVEIPYNNNNATDISVDMTIPLIWTYYLTLWNPR